MSKTPVTTLEAAKLLGCSQRTVQRMIDHKVLSAWKITPGLKSVWMVQREDIDAILSARGRVVESKKRGRHHELG